MQQLFDIIETDSVVRMQHLHACCTNLKLHIFINVSASVWISCLLIVFRFSVKTRRDSPDVGAQSGKAFMLNFQMRQTCFHLNPTAISVALSAFLCLLFSPFFHSQTCEVMLLSFCQEMCGNTLLVLCSESA